jgi:hypothetical protein
MNNPDPTPQVDFKDAIKGFESTVAQYKIFDDTNFNELQTGDLIFFVGNYSMSAVTRWMTDSPWGHVAVVVNMDDIMHSNVFDNQEFPDTEFNLLYKKRSPYFIFESVHPQGCRLLNFYKANSYSSGKPYKGRMAVFRIKQHPKPADYKQKFRDFMFSTLSENYDVINLFGLAAKAYTEFKLRLKTSKAKNTNPPFYCTELVYFLTKYTYGLELVDKKEVLIPKNFVKESNLELLGELKLPNI